MEVLFTAHFMPRDGGTVLMQEDERNRATDTAFIEAHSSGFAAFAYQQFEERGPGCVVWDVERAEELEATLDENPVAFLHGIPPDRLGLRYLDAREYPHPEASTLGAELPDDIRLAADQLSFALRVLIHQYEPDTEYLVLLTQDGGPHRLYRMKPKAIAPVRLGQEGPQRFN